MSEVKGEGEKNPEKKKNLTGSKKNPQKNQTQGC